MKYFTRELYQKYQLVEGMTPEEEEKLQDEGERLWNIALQKYQAHLAEIKSFLPTTIQQFLNNEFHDSMIISVVQHGHASLRLELDTCHAPWIEGDRYWLTFSQGIFLGGTGVNNETYWLYDEIHLSKHAKFEIHVLCQAPDLQMSELQIAADDLKIEQKA